MRFFLNVVTICILTMNITAQNVTSRLSVYSGGNIEFNFNSIKKYNDGIIYTNYTKLSIYFIDTNDLGVPNPLARWKRTMKANTANIEGDGGDNLPLSTIEVTTTNDVGFPTASYVVKEVLTQAGSDIITNGLQGSGTVNITYDVGTTTSLLGVDFDHYFVDIMYTLGPE